MTILRTAQENVNKRIKTKPPTNILCIRGKSNRFLRHRPNWTCNKPSHLWQGVWAAALKNLKCERIRRVQFESDIPNDVLRMPDGDISLKMAVEQHKYRRDATRRHKRRIEQPRDVLTIMSAAVGDNIGKRDDIEILLCREDDLRYGQMKEIHLEDSEFKLLLVRNEDGDYCAFGSKCPHNGHPLSAGILKNGRIRCSRHGACFNSKTGDIEDFPGLDSLPRYNVCTQDKNVILRATRRDLIRERRIKSMKAQACNGNNRVSFNFKELNNLSLYCHV